MYAAPGLVMNISLTSLNPVAASIPIEARPTARSLATPAFGTGILSISQVGIGTTTTGFFKGEDVKGLTSGALFSVSIYDKDDSSDKYNEGDIFESEADLLIDFTESNPFGSFYP